MLGEKGIEGLFGQKLHNVALISTNLLREGYAVGCGGCRFGRTGSRGTLERYRIKAILLTSSTDDICGLQHTGTNEALTYEHKNQERHRDASTVRWGGLTSPEKTRQSFRRALSW